MKRIHLTFDEELLRRLDTAEETLRTGRSAVLRRATAEYLGRQRHKRIADSYRRGYATEVDLGDEFRDWERTAVWPEK